MSLNDSYGMISRHITPEFGGASLYCLDILAEVSGWLYFFAWSISFYPQTYINWHRKSVVGLNFDFLSLGLYGFVCYTIYNFAMYYSPSIKEEYFLLHHTRNIPVEMNDIVFSIHASLVSIVLVIQCCCYERGNQRVSNVMIGALLTASGGALIYLVITLAGIPTSFPWLTYIYYFSYVKLASTVFKYVPQAYYNFSRKSTEGWSIGMVILDFTGGILSLLQMFIIAHNYDEWSSLFGNFTKFGIAAISITFDVIFIFQHYCLYRKTEHEKLPILKVQNKNDYNSL